MCRDDLTRENYIVIALLISVPIIAAAIILCIVLVSKDYFSSSSKLLLKSQYSRYLVGNGNCSSLQIAAVVEKISPDVRKYKFLCTALNLGENLAVALPECFESGRPVKGKHYLTSGSPFWTISDEHYEIVNYTLFSGENSSIVVLVPEPQLPGTCPNDTLFVEGRFNRDQNHYVMGWNSTAKEAMKPFRTLPFRGECVENMDSALIFTEDGRFSGFQSVNCTQTTPLEHLVVSFAQFAQAMGKIFRNVTDASRKTQPTKRDVTAKPKRKKHTPKRFKLRKIPTSTAPTEAYESTTDLFHLADESIQEFLKGTSGNMDYQDFLTQLHGSLTTRPTRRPSSTVREVHEFPNIDKFINVFVKYKLYTGYFASTTSGARDNILDYMVRALFNSVIEEPTTTEYPLTSISELVEENMMEFLEKLYASTTTEDTLYGIKQWRNVYEENTTSSTLRHESTTFQIDEDAVRKINQFGHFPLNIELDFTTSEASFDLSAELRKEVNLNLRETKKKKGNHMGSYRKRHHNRYKKSRLDIKKFRKQMLKSGLVRQTIAEKRMISNKMLMSLANRTITRKPKVSITEGVKLKHSTKHQQANNTLKFGNVTKHFTSFSQQPVRIIEETKQKMVLNTTKKHKRKRRRRKHKKSTTEDTGFSKIEQSSSTEFQKKLVTQNEVSGTTRSSSSKKHSKITTSYTKI
ncbi:unnamed protein product [Phyllotreta striolata]|uniref:Uncharacterized protein n=1 Tax=Phyllotreta striolata TaxID=444603 RepID=A0A9P0DNC2_PHYSR|nr:unnamed protein product [Phyllotreta striolata]